MGGAPGLSPGAEGGGSIAVEHVVGPAPRGQAVGGKVRHRPIQTGGGGIDDQIELLSRQVFQTNPIYRDSPRDQNGPIRSDGVGVDAGIEPASGQAHLTTRIQRYSLPGLNANFTSFTYFVTLGRHGPLRQPGQFPGLGRRAVGQGQAGQARRQQGQQHAPGRAAGAQQQDAGPPEGEAVIGHQIPNQPHPIGVIAP